jgi:hypothetical protein
MRRSIEALVVVPMLVAMAIFSVYGIAQAEPVQQFAFQVTGSDPNDVSVHLHLRRFDTTGAVPPTPTGIALRLPAGVRLNPALLTARYRCDAGALRDALDARPSWTPFNMRVAHLDVFARELARNHGPRDRAALPNVRACERARIGGGSGVIDARDAIRVLTDPIPFRFSAFLTAGTVPGAIAGLAALGAADPRSAVVHRYSVVAGVHAVEQENFLPDPSPDGLYGLELAIDTGPINGFQLSRARVDATVRSLVVRDGACLARGRGGRCVRRQRADASLFTLPRCPASGRYSVQLLTAYPPPTPSATTTVEPPCPRFVP